MKIKEQHIQLSYQKKNTVNLRKSEIFKKSFKVWIRNEKTDKS